MSIHTQSINGVFSTKKMPIELINFHYNSRVCKLKVINLSYDFGKMNCYFYERDIDNIFNINSLKLKKKPLIGQCLFKEIKQDIFFNMNDYYAPKLNGNGGGGGDSNNNNLTTSSRLHGFSLSDYIDDDDEVLLSEIAIFDYFFNFVNRKKNQDFLILWKCFLDYEVRNINNLIRIKLERAGVDIFSSFELNSVSKINPRPIKFIPPLVDYIYIGQTKSMAELKHYLITFTCDYNLTLNHINQFSNELYYTIGFVPVANVEMVYQQILKIVHSCSEVHAKKIHGKIFYLTNDLFENIYKFVESNRTNKEFE